jgi:hypothetical protein
MSARTALYPPEKRNISATSACGGYSSSLFRSSVMKCARCKHEIDEGVEVFYRKAPYHDHCAAQQAKEERDVTKVTQDKPKFRLIIGGKK